MKNIPDIISSTYQQITQSLKEGGRGRLKWNAELRQALEQHLPTDLNDLWRHHSEAQRLHWLSVLQALPQAFAPLTQRCQEWRAPIADNLIDMECMLALQMLEQQWLAPAQRDGRRLQAPIVLPLLAPLLRSNDWSQRQWAVLWLESHPRLADYQSLHFPLPWWQRLDGEKRALARAFQQVQLRQ